MVLHPTAGYPGTGVTDVSEFLSGCWEWNLDSPKERLNIVSLTRSSVSVDGFLPWCFVGSSVQERNWSITLLSCKDIMKLGISYITFLKWCKAWECSSVTVIVRIGEALGLSLSHKEGMRQGRREKKHRWAWQCMPVQSAHRAEAQWSDCFRTNTGEGWRDDEEALRSSCCSSRWLKPGSSHPHADTYTYT